MENDVIMEMFEIPTNLKKGEHPCPLCWYHKLYPLNARPPECQTKKCLVLKSYETKRLKDQEEKDERRKMAEDLRSIKTREIKRCYAVKRANRL